MKTLFTFILCLISVIARADVYEHRYFNATFPDTNSEHFEVSVIDNFEKITYRNDSVSLKIRVLPVSMRLSHPEWLGQKFGLAGSNGENVTDCSLCGKQMVKFSSVCCESDSTFSYSNIYLFSNGEITLKLVETGCNRPIDWWTENIDLMIPDGPTHSLSERTNGFEDFFNRSLNDHNDKIKITHDDGHLKIDIVNTRPSSDDSGDLGAMRLVYGLINMFTVFEEYASLGYTFSVKMIDGEGDVVCDSTFTPDEYSTWCDDTFIEKPTLEVIAEDDPEIILEEIEVVEIVEAVESTVP